MHRALAVAVGLLAGVLAFVGVGVGVTEALAPYVRPSAAVGLPAGVAAGVAAVPLAYYGLRYRAERGTPAGPSARTVARFWAAAAALAGFVVGGGLAAVALAVSTRSVGFVGAVVLAGLPAGVVAAAGAARYALTRDWSGATSPEAPERVRQ